jgi:hypothetical protein
MESMMTVKLAKGLSGRRFATTVEDLKRWGLTYHPMAKTWSLSDADRNSLIVGRLRSYISGELLELAA